MPVGNFMFTPQSSGAIITDCVQYTPTFTGFGTVSSVGFYSRRVGQTLEVRGNYGSGTATAVAAKMTVGFNGTSANVTVDATNVASTACGIFAVGATGQFPSMILYPASNDTTVSFGKSSATTNPVAAANGDTLAGSGQSIQVFFSVKIVGW